MIAKIEAEYDTKLKDFENSIGLWEALHAAEEAEGLDVAEHGTPAYNK